MFMKDSSYPKNRDFPAFPWTMGPWGKGQSCWVERHPTLPRGKVFITETGSAITWFPTVPTKKGHWFPRNVGAISHWLINPIGSHGTGRFTYIYHHNVNIPILWILSWNWSALETPWIWWSPSTKASRRFPWIFGKQKPYHGPCSCLDPLGFQLGKWMFTLPKMDMLHPKMYPPGN